MRPARKLVAAAAAVTVAVTALSLVASASAHPLGNFTINRSSHLVLSGDRLYVLYVLDMAEIPTFQARQAGVDPGAYARRIAAGVRLTANGRPDSLVPLAHALVFPRGAGGLRTLRLEIVLRGPRLRGRTSVFYHDNNYRSRIGWHEIYAGGERGARLARSDVPAQSRSKGLRAYPRNLLQSPLAVDTARLEVDPGSAPGLPPALTRGVALQAPDRVADGGFARLIVRDRLSTGVVLLSLLLALFWGAAHALSPGHGKSIVAAYLVGSRGKARHAFLLGLIVTVTHTIGVFALGSVTLALSQFVVPDTLYPWLNLASALLVVAVGVAVFRSRFADARHERGHAHGHAHAHPHGHAHGPEADTGLRGLIGVGISGGILPCPTALVVLLAAISLHRVGYGLVLIVAFSLGLAAAITAIGLVAVTARHLFARTSLDGRLIRALPTLSALAVLGLGLVMTVRALPGVS